MKLAEWKAADLQVSGMNRLQTTYSKAVAKQTSVKSKTNQVCK